MSRGTASDRVLAHISPHPDDEALGSPSVLLALRQNGWKVVNLVVSMGRPQQRERRSGEAVLAAKVAGFELRTPLPPIGLSGTDDLEKGFDRTRSEVLTLLEECKPAIVVAPSPHDGHHAHELVGSAVLSAIEASGQHPRLWLWGLWADLPFPTIFAGFGEDLMSRAQETIQCYVGEIERNDYSVLLSSRARANAILGAERVFGYGHQSDTAFEYADVLTECELTSRGWVLGSGRLFDAMFEPGEFTREQEIGWWLESASPQERRRRSGGVS